MDLEGGMVEGGEAYDGTVPELQGVDAGSLLGAVFTEAKAKLSMRPPAGWESLKSEEDEVLPENPEEHPGREVAYFVSDTSSLELMEMPEEVPVEAFMLDAYRQLMEAEEGVMVTRTALSKVQGRPALRIESFQDERFTITLLIPAKQRTIAATGGFEDERQRLAVQASLLSIAIED